MLTQKAPRRPLCFSKAQNSVSDRVKDMTAKDKYTFCNKNYEDLKNNLQICVNSEMGTSINFV